MLEFDKFLSRVLKKQLDGFESLIETKRLTSGASRITFEVSTICHGEEKKIALRLNPKDQNDDGLMSQRISPLSEAKVMKLARSVGVPTPRILYILEKADNLGEGYLMEWMDGESLGSRIVKSSHLESIRPVLAKQCGKILGQIHSIDLISTDLGQFLETISPAEYVLKQYKIYQSLGVQRPMIDYVARWLMDNLPRYREPCLVHNDFRNGNLLVDKRIGISGVLDWEIAHIGNPIRDLGWLCTKSWRFGVPEKTVGGFGTLEDLLKAYKDAGGPEVDNNEIKFWTIFGSFWWAIACLLMEKSYQNGNDQSIERPIIGRRISECEVDCASLLMPGKIDSTFTEVKNFLEKSTEPLLLASVRDFIKDDIIERSNGRTKFLAKIACNAIDIVIRENRYGPKFNALEKDRLQKLLGSNDDLTSLRSQLVSAIKNREIPLDSEALKKYLRESALSQILIDQPNYPGAYDLSKAIF